MTVRPSVRATVTSSPSPGHRLGPRPGQHGQPAPGEDVLQHLRRVGILARQHPIARGDEHDLAPERVVRAGELRTGHPRADHDQPLRQLAQAVDLGPGEDPLAVRLGLGQLPRRARRSRSRSSRRRSPAPRRPSRRSPAPGRPAVRGRPPARPSPAAPVRRCRPTAAGPGRAPARSPRRGRRAPRPRTSGRSASPKRRPNCADSCTSVITSAVAIRVLDGTQSVSTADPPRPSVSIKVTSPPSWLPTRAAS